MCAVLAGARPRARCGACVTPASGGRWSGHAAPPPVRPPHSPPVNDFDLLDDHVRALGTRLRPALSAPASRNRAPDARLLLARAALGDHGTLEELLAAARAGDRRRVRRLRRKGQPLMVTAVAQAIALQDLRPEDTTDALALYDLIRRAFGPRALSPANQALHAQLAL